MIKNLLIQNALHSSATSHSSLSLTIVNTEGCGKRIKLSKAILSKLGNPTGVGFSPNGDKGSLAIYADPENGYHLCKGNLIYAADLVNQLTELFGLDFSHRTSLCFTNMTVKHDDDDDMNYIEIVVKQGDKIHDEA